MLQKLREKIGVPVEKLPDDLVVKYGNSSGVCIPLVITAFLSDEMKKESYKCCLSAFGAGLAWGAMVMELGNLDFCEIITSDL